MGRTGSGVSGVPESGPAVSLCVGATTGAVPASSTPADAASDTCSPSRSPSTEAAAPAASTEATAPATTVARSGSPDCIGTPSGQPSNTGAATCGLSTRIDSRSAARSLLEKKLMTSRPPTGRGSMCTRVPRRSESSFSSASISGSILCLPVTLSCATRRAIASASRTVSFLSIISFTSTSCSSGLSLSISTGRV